MQNINKLKLNEKKAKRSHKISLPLHGEKEGKEDAYFHTGHLNIKACLLL